VEKRLHRRFGVRAESSVECGGHGGSLGASPFYRDRL
jgi:hypothetical protein